MHNKLPVKILALSSSPRRGGVTEKLLLRFVASAKKRGARVTTLRLYDALPEPVSGKLGKKIRKLSRLQKAVYDADGFVIFTPTYWFNVPGVLKNFIDQLTVFEENGWLLEGKVAGFIVYAPQGGETGALSALALPLNHMGAVFVPYSFIFYRDAKDRWAIRDLDLLAKNMIQQICAQKTLGTNWDYEKRK